MNMNFKIDTKEKFNEITLLEPQISANMSDNITKLLSQFLEKEVKNVVISFENVNELDLETAKLIAALQKKYYDTGASFVICGLKPAIEQILDENDLLENMNITPTCSEAWDIVQMEEIERELLRDF